jgi:2'-5' RNA ligase
MKPSWISLELPEDLKQILENYVNEYLINVQSLCYSKLIKAKEGDNTFKFIPKTKDQFHMTLVFLGDFLKGKSKKYRESFEKKKMRLKSDSSITFTGFSLFPPTKKKFIDSEF